MKWLLMFPLALLLACNSMQLTPVDPQPMDWKRCPALLSIPVPEGGWKRESWIWKDDALLVERNNHLCIDQTAKNSEENERRVLLNKRAYEQKQTPFLEAMRLRFEGAGGLTLLMILLYVATLF